MTFSPFYPKAWAKNKDGSECSAVVSVHYTLGLHTHVPWLITPVHVVMRKSAQRSDVICLKGI